MFCAAEFKNNEIGVRLENECILPIILKKPLASGNSGETHRIMLHSAYNFLEAKGASDKDPSGRFADTYVLKTYSGAKAEKYYRSEVEAFRKLMSSSMPVPNMITFYGSFVQNETFNIILEYADKGTLEDYFRTEAPPMDSLDIIKFWRGLFGVIQPLQKIHSVRSADSEEPQIFQGWHQDVKPANILVKSCNRVSPYEYEFKLADLGLSHFRAVVNGQQDISDRDTRGTHTYGAPECYRSDEFLATSRIEVKQNVDVWSLGCIYSEAATWVVQGWKGLQAYRLARLLETSSMNFDGGDCFHNGEAVLATVINVPEKLKDFIRPSDHVTKPVLELMVREMLEDAVGRPTAIQLWRKASRILREAEKNCTRPNADQLSRAHPKHSIKEGSQPSLPSDPHTPPYSPTTPYQNGPSTQPSSSQKARRIPSDPRSQPPPTFGDFHRQHSPEPMEEGDEERQHPPNRDNPRRARKTTELRNHTPPSLHNEGEVDDDQFDETTSLVPYGPYTNTTLPRIPRQYYTSASHDSFQNQALTEAGFANEGAYRNSTGSFHNPPSRKPTQQTIPEGIPGRYSVHLPKNNSHQLPPPPPTSGSRKAPANKRRPPLLPVATALQWKNDKKNRVKGTHLPDDQFLFDLNHRDHVFLIDDSTSMQDHWAEVQTLFSLLAYMVKDSDPDGIELYFTILPSKYREKHVTNLLKRVKERFPYGDSDVKSRLWTILQDYQTKLHHQNAPKSIWGKHTAPKPPRPLNLYILTDGVWQPDCDASMPIQYLVEKLEELKLPDGQVGIEFISFGNDKTGLERMERLDSELNLKRDIVDTEPSNGNVWKMLLGAINKWFDDDEEKKAISPVQAGSPTTIPSEDVFE